jgi:Rrf2 family protein
MAHLTVSVEYGLHCLLWLSVAGDKPRSGRDLAAFESIPPSFLAKILSKLQKAGIVRSTEGVRGGYVLNRTPNEITLLEVVDAIEGRKPLFECQGIRSRCALFGGNPPVWVTGSVCSIHAAMLKAEKAMRDSLKNETLADIGRSVGRKAPTGLPEKARRWFDERSVAKMERQDNLNAEHPDDA